MTNRPAKALFSGAIIFRPKSQTLYRAHEIGQMIADSDLGIISQESCIDFLVGRGISADQVDGDLSHIIVEAHNIRHGRDVARQASRAAAFLLPFVLGGAALLGLASEAAAAERGPAPGSGLIQAIWFTLIILVLIALVFGFREQSQQIRREIQLRRGEFR